jgi:biotin operon repressor
LEASQIISALLIGHAEGRPNNASKLAHYLGIPRTNVKRRLAKLERDGIIERHGNEFVLVPQVFNSEVWLTNVRAVVGLINGPRSSWDSWNDAQAAIVRPGARKTNPLCQSVPWDDLRQCQDEASFRSRK